MSGTVETDPSVCYRHPGRQSWVLCQRCGKTVCPECQILAPVGVHCPDCVAETSGGVAWRPTGTVTPIAKARGRRRPAAAERVRSLLAPRGLTVSASSVVLVAAVAMWAIGSFSPLPVQWLAAVSSGLGLSPLALPELQLWRYVTAPLVSSGGLLSLQGAVFFALSAVFFWLTAPQLERMLGIRPFLVVVGAGAVVGNVAMVLAGSVGFGLSSVVFAAFAALLVTVWDQPPVRTQILVMIGVNLMITVVLSPSFLPMLVGAMLGGGGALHLLRIGPDRGWRTRTPALLIGGVCLGLVLIAAAKGALL